MIRIEVPYEVRNVATAIVCDILVDVDIRLIPMFHPDSVQANISLEAVQGKLRMLSGEMEQLIKDRIREAVVPTDPTKEDNE